jgi:perosamine synthetase
VKRSFLPLSEPLLAGNEARYVAECVTSGWISTSGPFVSRFETQLARAVGAPHAVATQSGTAALHTALAALGIGEGDAVAVSTLSFIAPANAVRYVGALPIFVDAEAEYGQLDPAQLEALLEDECDSGSQGLIHRASGRRLRAVLPVHVLGHPAEMPRIVAIARRFGLFVVEDAAEALGARIRGDASGSDAPEATAAAGTFGDIGCFSFNGNKTVTAGGGGALVCHDSRWAARARHLTLQAKADAKAYVHDEIGFNYRMTGLHAAVGCAQLEQLASHVERKRDIRKAYAAAIADIAGLSLLPEAPWAVSSAWLTAVRIDAPVFGAAACEVVDALAAAGIGARRLWQPLHRSPAHTASAAMGGGVAERLHDEVVCLPSSPGLREADLRRVVDVLGGCAPVRRAFRVASA